MNFIPNILFAIVLFVGVGYFVRNVKKLRRNIKLGHDIDVSDNKSQRWKNMAMIAMGQSKMVRRPVAGIMHLIVYVGFIIINIEVLEIIIDGLLGTHQYIFYSLGSIYGFLIGRFEILAVLVLIAVIVFWIRRMVIRIPRFWNKEMTKWPKNDALYILYFEMVLNVFILNNECYRYPISTNGFRKFDQSVHRTLV